MPSATMRLKWLLRTALGAHGYERLVFRHHLGYWPDLKNPTSFCEKIAYRKLYYTDARYVALSDKVAVRSYVAEKWGDDILTTLFGIMSPGDNLPPDLPPMFFIKAAYGSGINHRVTDFTSGRRAEILRLADGMLRREHVYGRLSNQWWYERIPKRLMFEEVLIDSRHGVPLDFKFYCFHGKVHLVQIDFNRFEQHTRSYFDRDWNFLPYTSVYPQGPAISRPPNLEQMINVAEVLSEDLDFVRVDLYDVDDTRIVFGEMTFAPEAGWVVFSPTQEPDWEAGRLWTLATHEPPRTMGQ